jgi:hypothetical protein
VAFDLYGFDMLRALHYPLPAALGDLEVSQLTSTLPAGRVLGDNHPALTYNYVRNVLLVGTRLPANEQDDLSHLFLSSSPELVSQFSLTSNVCSSISVPETRTFRVGERRWHTASRSRSG